MALIDKLVVISIRYLIVSVNVIYLLRKLGANSNLALNSLVTQDISSINLQSVSQLKNTIPGSCNGMRKLFDQFKGEAQVGISASYRSGALTRGLGETHVAVFMMTEHLASRTNFFCWTRCRWTFAAVVIVTIILVTFCFKNLKKDKQSCGYDWYSNIKHTVYVYKPFSEQINLMLYHKW